MGDVLTTAVLGIVAAGFFVGVVVGLTGMGGGALMTPALIFLGVGDAATVVTADLTAAAVYKTGGAIVHKREGSPHMKLAGWLVLGSMPGTVLGGLIAPRVRQSVVRRGIVIVLTMSGIALLDKAGWAPLGAGEDETHPMLIGLVGLVMLLLVPLVWGVLRRTTGLPFWGAPTLAEVEDPTYRPGGWRAPPRDLVGSAAGPSGTDS